MPKFEVPVTRIGYKHLVIEVDADDRETAEKKALEEAPSRDFGSERDYEYQIEDY